MLLDIFLRDGNNVQIESFESFTMALKDWTTFEAEKLSSVRLDDKATYTFKGEITVMLSGKDIMYLKVI